MFPLGSDVVVIESGVACTVSDVPPDTPDSVAEIVVVPAEAAAANPAEFMVATTVADDAQVTWVLRFCVLPSEYVPVAVNC